VASLSQNDVVEAHIYNMETVLLLFIKIPVCVSYIEKTGSCFEFSWGPDVQSSLALNLWKKKYRQSVTAELENMEKV
jgi:hypothetical protein